MWDKVELGQTWILTFFFFFLPSLFLFRMFYLDLRDCLDRNGSREMGMGFFSGNGTFRTPVRSVKRPVLENRVKVI